MDLPFKIAIPSRGRAALIHENPLWQIAHVVVDDEDERDSYAAAGVPEENLVIADPCANISVLRQWIQDTLWEPDEPFIVQSDDDLTALKPLMRWRASLITSAADIAAILWESYISAADIGAGMFGYSIAVSRNRAESAAPVYLRRPVYVLVGICDRSLAYDEQFFVGEDTDLCHQSFVNSRVIWKDDRFGMTFRPHYQAGGISKTRTEQTYDRSIELLIRKWGTRGSHGDYA